MHDVLVEIENNQKDMAIDESIMNIIESAIEKCIKNENFDKPCEVFVTLVDNPAIQEINKANRNIAKATDVLSFPMLDMVNGQILSDISADFNPETGRLLLGDIVISIEKVVQQAEAYGHSFSRELAFLTTHGIFHLLGYDHQDSQQEKNMISKQEDVLKLMGMQR